MFIPDKYLTVLDFETTESLTALPEIIEIGAVKIDANFDIVDRFETLVRPRDLSRVDRQITRLTGLTQDELETAETFDDVWEKFAEFTSFNFSRLCSWNTSFDIAVLREEYRSRGLGFPHNQASVDALSVVWTIASLWGLKLGGMGLNKACERFGVIRGDIHRALSDAESVVQIFKEIRNLALEDLEDGTSRQFLPTQPEGQG
jgi:DNA polymerase III alpha subunit (gram-positive type)